MKYIKVFNNSSEYEEYMSDSPILPNVSIIKDEKKSNFNIDIINKENSHTIMQNLYDAGYSSNENFITRQEIESIKDSMILETILPTFEGDDYGYSLYGEESYTGEYSKFHEFKYFINVGVDDSVRKVTAITRDFSEITIPYGIEEVDFQYCFHAKNIVLPETVKNFSHTGVQDVFDLEPVIYCKSTTPPEISIDANNVTIYCPVGCLEAYSEKFADNLQYDYWQIIETIF